MSAIEADWKKAIIEPRPIPPGDVLKTYADIDATRRNLGFGPVTPISVGIPRLIDWYKGYYGMRLND